MLLEVPSTHWDLLNWDTKINKQGNQHENDYKAYWREIIYRPGSLNANGKWMDRCFSAPEIVLWKCSASKIWIVAITCYSWKNSNFNYNWNDFSQGLRPLRSIDPAFAPLHNFQERPFLALLRVFPFVEYQAIFQAGFPQTKSVMILVSAKATSAMIWLAFPTILVPLFEMFAMPLKLILPLGST